MTSHVTATLPPPASGVVRVCVIDTESTFCELMEETLAEMAMTSVKLVAVFDRIPDQGKWGVDAVVFDPHHPDFRAVDGIVRVQQLFGEKVTLIARLAEGDDEEFLEDLEVSGVAAGLPANDYSGFAQYLNELSHTLLARSDDISTAKTPLVPNPLDGAPEIEVKIEPPVETSKRTVCIGIIHTDPALATYLSAMLRSNKDLDGHAQVQDTFYEIPTKDEVERIINVVVFDPDMSDFRDMAQAVKQMRATFGQDVVMIAHSDAWHADSRLRRQMLAAGIRAGIGLENLKGLVRIMELLIRSELRTIYEEFQAH